MASRAVLVLVLVVVFVLGLVGCGSDDDGDGTDGRAPEATRPVDTESAQPVPKGPVKGEVEIVESSLPPEARIDMAIKGVLASGVPGLACSRYATKRYVEATFGDRGGCVQSTVPASAATSVKVTAIRISDETARAVAIPTGGPSGGERIRVELVRAGPVWKVDVLRSNAPVGP
jgi:hypothetical protein